MPIRRVLTVALLLLVIPAARAADPTDNPIATFYSGPEGYPAWTDSVNWSRVINMKEYKKGKNHFEKFVNATRELAAGGGVLYYPADEYDFSTKNPGKGLELPPGVVIRGEAPTSHQVAADGKLELKTKFLFPFKDRRGGKVPGDWNFITIMVPEGRYVRDVGHIGIAWVHLVGATVAFGPDVEWGKTWGQANGLRPAYKVKEGPAGHEPTGTHPIDALLAGKQYQGGARGRFVFGCVLQDAAVMDDFLDPGYGTNGFHASRYCARVVAYGSRVLVANNLLPESRKTFRHPQRVKTSGEKEVPIAFDYGKTCGIDVNKELLLHARQGGSCPGYFEEGVVVRDNWVYNHGHTGYSVSGKWVSITGNHNERALLRPPEGGMLTLDGWEVAGPESDNRSRAFDLAGRNVWVHGNHFNNTGSLPGNDGEGIVCRPATGTQLFSWAVTHNVHARGTGAAGGIGGLDADCHGLLIAWNQTPGWIGNLTKRKDATMTDCAFVAGKGERVVPEAKVPPPGLLTPPIKVTAQVNDDGDAVRVTWEGGSDYAIGFKVERRIGGGKWQAIAYRPPRVQGDAENPQAWVDFTAPTGKELTYRVVSINTEDGDKGAGKPTEAVTLAGQK
jgi:hypothetical protein